MNTTITIMTNKTKKILLISGASLIIVLGIVYWLFFSHFSTNSKPSYVYIDNDDTADSVFVKVKEAAHPNQCIGLKICSTLLSYSSHVHPGRYATGEGISTFRLIRNLRGGRQTPVALVIPVVHTMDNLAARLSNQLEADSMTLAKCFKDTVLLKQMGVDTATVACLFLPNTYEVYWDIAPQKLLLRMKKEHDAFWTAARKKQAAEAGITPDEAYTLASIVEQESANEKERPMIAGMYLNRLHQGMKLQADPTVKFALKDFALRRIMLNHLSVNSPYNTYQHTGLPIGPICIPSLNAIESVLHYAHHDYVYMCAKEDFSGTHNFAATYAEHMQNAKRYADALNKRGIN